MKVHHLIALLCAFVMNLAAFTASAATPSAQDTYAAAAAGELAAAKRSVIALRESADRGIITRSQADEAVKPYLAAAAKAAGHPVTEVDLLKVSETVAGPAPQLTALQRVAGFVTFTSLIWVIGIVLGVVCIAILFGHYISQLIKLLKDVPFVAYEVIFYSASLATLWFGRGGSPDTAPYFGLTGALLLAAAVGFSSKMRKFASNGFRYWSILFVVWTAAALLYGSTMLGFIAVVALLAAMGFSAGAGPLCFFIGFEDDSAVGKGTLSAFVVLALFVVMRILGAHVPAPLKLFEFGSLFMGSFVFYLGLLVSSSRWFRSKHVSYAVAQILPIVAGIAALFIGSVFGIPELLKIGGTFFVLYLIEKMVDIPAKDVVGYAFVGLFVAGFMFSFGWYAKTHMDTLAPYLFTLQ